MDDAALLVHHEGHSAGNQPQQVIGAIGLSHLADDIAQQHKGQAVPLRELDVCGPRVATDADHLSTRGLEILIAVAERAGLCRAPGGVVLRVEVDHHALLAPIIAQLDQLAVLVLQFKIGGHVAHCYLTHVFVFSGREGSHA